MDGVPISTNHSREVKTAGNSGPGFYNRLSTRLSKRLSTRRSATLVKKCANQTTQDNCILLRVPSVAGRSKACHTSHKRGQGCGLPPSPYTTESVRECTRPNSNSSSSSVGPYRESAYSPAECPPLSGAQGVTRLLLMLPPACVCVCAVGRY